MNAERSSLPKELDEYLLFELDNYFIAGQTLMDFRADYGPDLISNGDLNRLVIRSLFATDANISHTISLFGE